MNRTQKHKKFPILLRFFFFLTSFACRAFWLQLLLDERPTGKQNVRENNCEKDSTMENMYIFYIILHNVYAFVPYTYIKYEQFSGQTTNGTQSLQRVNDDQRNRKRSK